MHFGNLSQSLLELFLPGKIAPKAELSLLVCKNFAANQRLTPSHASLDKKVNMSLILSNLDMRSALIFLEGRAEAASLAAQIPFWNPNIMTLKIVFT